MKSLVRVLVPVLSVVALFACDRSERAQRERDIDRSGVGDPFGVGEKHGTTTVTGATAALANETAIERIVASRCAREAACDKIGGDKRFTSRDTCVQKLRVDMTGDLERRECPRGIDAKELEECLEEIRTESCNNPIDTISRLAACRASDLCLKTDTTNR